MKLQTTFLALTALLVLPLGCGRLSPQDAETYGPPLKINAFNGLIVEHMEYGEAPGTFSFQFRSPKKGVAEADRILKLLEAELKGFRSSRLKSKHYWHTVGGNHGDFNLGIQLILADRELADDPQDLMFAENDEGWLRVRVFVSKAVPRQGES